MNISEHAVLTETTLLEPDICVIGAGSGGLTVAAAAAAFGVDVVLIEKGKMGGDCLNYGCVPSKALLAAGKAAAAYKKAEAFGIHEGQPTTAFEQVNEHVHDVIAQIEPHDSVERFEGLGVTVLQGAARFVSENEVVVGATRIKARRFVLATGSRAAVPPIKGLADVPYLTNESLFDLKDAPEHLAIIGAGPIGMEMAQAHARLGCKVTILEAQTALAVFEKEGSEIVVDRLLSDGVHFHENAKVQEIKKSASGITVVYEDSVGALQELDASHLLVATGRKPNTEGLGLDEAGITHSPRGIEVDKGLRTSNRHVYAIGDAIGGQQFTHLAGAHGSLAIRSILFRLPVDHTKLVIPRVVYTEPELGEVGLTEKEAREKFGDKVQVLSASFSGNDRAVAERDTAGGVKLIVGKGGKLLGANAVGTQAGEIISMLSVMINKGMKVSDLLSVIFPYPTRAEIVKRAALSYYSEAPKKPLVRKLISLLQRLG
ncbi:dihydrolipoamide dehydrogenase [Rhodobacteraceae bacterium RKSG542]|uniref:dihydrolipoyl dehydrogenase family protein n=1 Tax=Pseudovibrio flavus TaxID=2529854 RepID=UPI0012BBEFD4|nr:FAD-dependent oxidoreductase [Pseudovibrio flavus]MTI17148.1 dihydrolipoamide dehydrogenase [Pseudovibrio flavus]